MEKPRMTSQGFQLACHQMVLSLLLVLPTTTTMVLIVDMFVFIKMRMEPGQKLEMILRERLVVTNQVSL